MGKPELRVVDKPEQPEPDLSYEHEQRRRIAALPAKPAGEGVAGMTFTAQDKLEAVERELAFRRRVYQRRVADGKMTQQLASRQIAVFEAIAADYQTTAVGERLL